MVVGSNPTVRANITRAADIPRLFGRRRYGPLAQLAEQQTLNLRVPGSIPGRLTTPPAPNDGAPGDVRTPDEDRADGSQPGQEEPRRRGRRRRGRRKETESRAAALRRAGARSRDSGRARPRSTLVRKRFAKEIEDDVRERLVSRLCARGDAGEGAAPARRPGPRGPRATRRASRFRFKTTFEVLPAFELKDYRGVEARQAAGRRSRSARSSEALERAAAVANARWSPTRRGWPSPGDVVVADVDGTPEGGERRSSASATMIEVGAAGQPPRLQRALCRGHGRAPSWSSR